MVKSKEDPYEKQLTNWPSSESQRIIPYVKFRLVAACQPTFGLDSKESNLSQFLLIKHIVQKIIRVEQTRAG